MTDQTVAVVIVHGWKYPPKGRTTDKVTVHESEELAMEWAEGRPDISHKGYEIHEQPIHIDE